MSIYRWVIIVVVVGAVLAFWMGAFDNKAPQFETASVFAPNPAEVFNFFGPESLRTIAMKKVKPNIWRFAGQGTISINTDSIVIITNERGSQRVGKIAGISQRDYAIHLADSVVPPTSQYVDGLQTMRSISGQRVFVMGTIIWQDGERVPVIGRTGIFRLP